MSDYLQLTVEKQLGHLSMRLSCALTAQWTVLFGPSGAGKTSLLRVLAGLTRPDHGQVVLEGRTLVATDSRTWVKPGDRGIGFVSQGPTLFPHMDVTANVAFGLSALPRLERDARVAQMLALFEARHLATRMPRDLSGGEQQRVALARALAPQPRLLLLDEPFSGMDGALRTTIVQRLTTWLAVRNIPALYVSHDVAEAFETRAEVLVMGDGRIQAQGQAREVLGSHRAQVLHQLGVSS